MFSQQFFGESHKLLNSLWIDLLQIRTGTDWLNLFIKSRKILLQCCFTSLINVSSSCLLVDPGQPVHGLFSIFSHGSNLFLNLDTVDRLNPMIFPIFFSLIHPDVAVIPAVFSLFCFSRHIGNPLFVAFTLHVRT